MNLKEISVLSGCSISTVSKALNNKYDVSNETRERIKKLAKDYNYIPNNAAVSLRKKKNKTIAIIVPQFTNGLLADIISQIQSLSFNIGYKLLILQSFDSSRKERECLNFINDGSVDGVIIMSLDNSKNNYNPLVTIPTIFLQLETLKRVNSNINMIGVKYFNLLFSKIN